MAHSPAYFAAAGAHDRHFGWEHATPEKIGDARIHALIGKVQIGPQPTEDVELYRQGATVTIEARGGRRATYAVLVPKGAAMLGVGWDDVAAKYRTLAPLAPMPAQTVETSLGLIKDLRSAPNVAALLTAIC
jgi:2-methylcitrate dehydratase PrpD